MINNQALTNQSKSGSGQEPINGCCPTPDTKSVTRQPLIEGADGLRCHYHVRSVLIWHDLASLSARVRRRRSNPLSFNLHIGREAGAQPSTDASLS